MSCVLVYVDTHLLREALIGVWARGLNVDCQCDFALPAEKFDSSKFDQLILLLGPHWLSQSFDKFNKVSEQNTDMAAFLCYLPRECGRYNFPKRQHSSQNKVTARIRMLILKEVVYAFAA